MTSATVSQAPDRRRAGRQRALLAGKLANEDATTTIDCTIRNLSSDGAMIETTTPHLIPAADTVLAGLSLARKTMMEVAR